MKRTCDISRTSGTPLSSHLLFACNSMLIILSFLKFCSLCFHDTVHCTVLVLPLSPPPPFFLSSLLISIIILFLNMCASVHFFIVCFSLNIHCLVLFQVPPKCAWLPKFSPGPNISPTSFHLQIPTGYVLLLVLPKHNLS